MSIYNFEKRQRLITKYLKSKNGIIVEDRKIIIKKDKLIFVFFMFQTNIQVYLPECFECPLDCNKSFEFYIGKAKLEDVGYEGLEREDLLLLAHIRDILEDNVPLEADIIQNKIKSKIFLLNFGLIGFDQVGKTTLFEYIPGKTFEISDLIQTYKKEILSFLPVKINIYDYGGEIMENLASKSPAPLLSENLRKFYLYILVTDSSAQNISATKQKLLPKLKKLSPYAAIIVIANKQDLPNRLSVQLIENILGERTYPFTATNQESGELFMNLLNEVILLRREQMQEYNCIFLEAK